MDHGPRIEAALAKALALAGTGAPPLLTAAMQHALFPGGARVRPRLCLAVAAAQGEHDEEAAMAAAIAIELLHCASLVHDDLPCFDDADLRRGQPTVHRAFGQPMAVLAGDALIVAAFEAIGRLPDRSRLIGPLLRVVGRAAGAPRGIVAGQAQEYEPEIDVNAYQAAKTGALFAAAAEAGAIAAGRDAALWRTVGERLGAAYQVADDLRDALADADEMGKPAGQDARLGKPNGVAAWGVAGALRRLQELIDEAGRAIPPCPGADILAALIAAEAQRLRPNKLKLAVA